MNHRISLFSLAGPLHGPRLTLSAFFRTERAGSSGPMSSCHNAGSCLVFDPRLFFLPFQAEQLRQYFCFPPLWFFPVSAMSMFHFQKRKRRARDPPIVDILFSTGCPYSCISDVCPKALFTDCMLSTTTSYVFPWRFIIHPRILNPSSKRNLQQTFRGTQNHILFRSVCARPSQACLAWAPNPLLPLLQWGLSKSASRCFLEWDMIQKLSAHMKV